MARNKVTLNSKAARALLQGPEVQADLRRRAESIRRSAGTGYATSVSVGPNRARGEVRTASYLARRREARQKTLTKALGAGRS